MALRTRSERSLWTDGRFVVFTVARTVSWAGTAITLVALPMLVFQRTGSPALTALLTAAEVLPYLLFGLLAGALADRWSRRAVMVVTSVGQAAVLASVPLADAFGVLGTAHLLVAALCTAAAGVFFDAASFSAIPELVGRDKLAEATGVSSGLSTVISMLGPGVGGVVAASLGPANAIGIDALSYAVAAVLLARLPLLRAASAPAGRPLRGDIAEGLRYVWRHPLIRPLTLLGIGNSLAAGAVLALLLPAAVEQLGLAADDARIGLLYAAVGAGALLATVVLPRLSRALPPGWVTLGGLLLSWVFLLGWVLATTFPVALAALALWQASNTLVVLNGILVRQRVTPDELQGRVNTTGRMIAWGGQPLGAVLGGGLAGVWGTSGALVCVGSAALAACLAGLCTPLRRRRYALV
ncbi:MFS transporter [Amycolatopsis suaedae]|uniref:MFS transporter n=1 Tax=Amycolatopsis suaedae TaxID=2510978 RepID=UPI0013EF06C6|nr:MFS transporter [Amycolatopsis suaedae]